MLNQQLLESRGVAGALLLDQKMPFWFERFEKLWNKDQTKLTNHYVRMAGTHECTLAQLFGRYADGVKALGLTDEETLGLGFRCSVKELKEIKTFGGKSYEHGMPVEGYYERLTLVWDREIEKRKKANGLA
ncbi:MAG TPA: hypothetical protein VJB70_00075 [Candidatus Paceibacterota bacterium]